jgi:RNA polymerase sigma-70 factor (ECF subfamily)
VETPFEQRLSRGRGGDRAALDELFARWRPLLCLQASQALGSDLAARVDPSDVVQEACARAFAELASFRGTSEGEWVAWLRAIVARQAVRTWRHHHAGKRSPDRERPLAGSPPAPGTAPLADEEAGRLAGALERLPGPMRQVVLRRIFHAEPFEAIAASLGCSCGAARVMWTRALRRLRADFPPES